MKTVAGTAVSSKPISLSKAAATLSSFLSADNGTSQAIFSYLRRASASFNELKQLHKDLNSSRSHRHLVECGKTALPSELKAEVESRVAEIEKKNKRHKKKSEDEDERDGKSQISANNGEIEATGVLVENNIARGKDRKKSLGNYGSEQQPGTKRRKGNL